MRTSLQKTLFLSTLSLGISACSTGTRSPSLDYVRRAENQFEMHVAGFEDEPMALTYRGAFDICRLERNLGFEIKRIEKQYYEQQTTEDRRVPELAEVNSLIECTGSIDPYLSQKYSSESEKLLRKLSSFPFEEGIEITYSSSVESP